MLYHILLFLTSFPQYPGSQSLSQVSQVACCCLYWPSPLPVLSGQAGARVLAGWGGGGPCVGHDRACCPVVVLEGPLGPSATILQPPLPFVPVLARDHDSLLIRPTLALKRYNPSTKLLSMCLVKKHKLRYVDERVVNHSYPKLFNVINIFWCIYFATVSLLPVSTFPLMIAEVSIIPFKHSYLLLKASCICFNHVTARPTFRDLQQMYQIFVGF